MKNCGQQISRTHKCWGVNSFNVVGVASTGEKQVDSPAHCWHGITASPCCVAVEGTAFEDRRRESDGHRAALRNIRAKVCAGRSTRETRSGPCDIILLRSEVMSRLIFAKWAGDTVKAKKIAKRRAVPRSDVESSASRSAPRCLGLRGSIFPWL